MKDEDGKPTLDVEMDLKATAWRSIKTGVELKGTFVGQDQAGRQAEDGRHGGGHHPVRPDDRFEHDQAQVSCYSSGRRPGRPGRRHQSGVRCPSFMFALLIAHGSRRPAANADLEWVGEQLRARGRYAHIQPAYLELAEPSIDAGAALCVESRCDRGDSPALFPLSRQARRGRPGPRPRPAHAPGSRPFASGWRNRSAGILCCWTCWKNGHGRLLKANALGRHADLLGGYWPLPVPGQNLAAGWCDSAPERLDSHERTES